MIKHYTLENKPKFKMNEQVAVDMRVMGMNECGILTGRIVGKGSENVVDTWLVEFNQDFSPTYPFRVVSVLHTAFLS